VKNERKTKKQILQKETALQERALQEKEERYRTIIENVEDGYYEIDLKGNLTFVNKALQKLSGYTKEELLGMSNRQYTSPETAKKMYEMYNEIFRTGIASKISNYECIRKDGTRKVLEVSASLIQNAAGVKTGFRGIVRDVTAWKGVEELHKTMVESSFAGVYVVQDGKFIFINSKGASYAGYDPEELVGRKANLIVHPEDREKVKNNAREMIAGNRVSPYEFRILTKKGGIRWIMETVTPIHYEGKPAILGNSMEISEKKQYEEDIRIMSITDQLTGIYNRRGFLTLAEQQIKVAERTQEGLLLLFADLDDMKMINDTMGHKKGDEALVDAARILKKVFRGSDIIARIGGDEFAVLALGASKDYPDALGQRLQHYIDLHNTRKKRGYDISMSIGMAYHDPEKPSTIDELMSRADELMYEQKKIKWARHNHPANGPPLTRKSKTAKK